MGWTVMGLGTINVDDKHIKEIYELMAGDKKEVVERLLGKEDGCEIEDVEITGNEIMFRMWGNKEIYYDRLDKIKEYCIKSGIGVEISVGEYVESEGGGYYFNSGDEDE